MRRYLSPEEASISYPFWVFLRDVSRFLRPHKRKFLIASVVRLLGDVAWLYPTYALASLVTFLTQYSSGQSLYQLWIIFALWILAVAIRVSSQFFAKYMGYQISEKVELDAVSHGIRHLFLLDMAWHERENSGNKLRRIQNGGTGLDRVIRIWFDSVIEIAINFGGAIFIISRFDLIIAGSMILFLLTHFIVSSFLIRKAARAAYVASIEDEKVTGLLFEAVSNIRSVKVMALAQPLRQLITAAMERLMAKIKTRILRFQLRSLHLRLLGWVFKFGALALIVVGVLKGRYEVGFLILFNGYFNDVWNSITELSDISQEVTVAKYGIARMNETLAEPITVDSEENKLPFPRDWKVLSVRGVSFAYGKNKVLSNISFDIKRGERVGVVGLSGAGKSTLFKLLLKEYETTKGNIYFDDVDLHSISKIDYFNYISVVLQDTEVFNFSLKENITLANSRRASDEELLSRAMNIAHVTEFLEKLPNGADTLIGERGIKLSGGEKQRLGIARAVFKEPQLLLLDEATSHLDLESEEKIKESLHSFFEHVTAIVIAHRLTTIKEMDKIILFERGRIIEMGNFEELYRQKGRFYTLWEKQKL